LTHFVPSNRRQFLKQSALGTVLEARAKQTRPPSGLSLSPYALPKFVDPLAVPSLAERSGSVPWPENAGIHVPYFRIAMREFQAKVHRDLPPTTFWGYDGCSPGPTFETRAGAPLVVEWANELPTRHLLPVDKTLHGAEPDKPEVRTVVHLHGAKVRPESDGNPEHWIVPGQSAICHYPNRQDAASLFYHDHAMGITRLNAIAGLFGFFFIRDPLEEALHLPRGRYEIPLAICDRIFKLNGQLDYPISGNPAAPWTSEFYGNAVLLNTKLFPFLEVEPRKYRFRLLNASNAGFYMLSLATDSRNLVPGNEPFYMIGSDQGFLSEPVNMKTLSITPGERADLIVDFAGYAGRRLYLKHAAAPVMEIRVSSGKSADSFSLPAKLRPIARTPESAAVKTRELTLVDYKDAAGKAKLMLLNGMHYAMPVTERPVLGTTEIWTLVNLTDDTHPIHLHLVRFQILDRRRFDFLAYKRTGKLVFTGPAIAPEPQEMGWKDTVRADVLMITRIIVRFEGYTGRYVWHCHVLEHEDNEMMRPFEVVAGS
jgi:spore coat protein A